MSLPLTAIVVTKNEERNIARCLKSLKDFKEIIVVDSASTDKTLQISKNLNANLIPFSWNGRYPKKRQWCLDHIETASEWIFFIDADEETTPAFCAALKSIDWSNQKKAGYFIRAAYCLNTKPLKHGLQNKKLCLINKTKMEFPVINDLDIPGMGEIEGHYQPVLKAQHKNAKIGSIKTPILHHALEDNAAWKARHRRYAAWEVEMDARGAWPQDPSVLRQSAKKLFKSLPGRPSIAFIHSYIVKCGFLDGKAGYDLALSRYRYYKMISALKASKAAGNTAATPSSKTVQS